MSKNQFSLIAAACILVSVGHKTPGAENLRFDTKDVEFRAVRASSLPYPYQAVRFRFSLRNISKKRLGPFGEWESLVGRAIEAPKETDDSEGKVLFPKPQKAMVATHRGNRDSGAPLFLEPGEETWVSFPIAVGFPKDRTKHPLNTGKVIFLVPGKYVVKFKLFLDYRRKEQIEKQVEIQVREPKGDDKAVLALLQKDIKLASAMVFPTHVPEADVVPKLKQIVEKYPKSSYADYAWLALAHAYHMGLGVDSSSGRVWYARAADVLDKVFEDGYDPSVEKVGPSGFAHMPDALITMKLVDLRERKFVLPRLHRQYPDAVEWQEEFATLLSRIAGDDAAEQLEHVLNRKIPFEQPQEELVKMINETWTAFRKKKPEIAEHK